LKLLHSTHRSAARNVAVAVAIVALVSSAVGASAGGPVKLGIKPIGESGSYFSLTMQPGESRELAVQLGNYGTDPVRARTFAADAYSLVNGGFGVRLDGEPSTGTTGWVTYPATDMDLAPGSGVEQTFTVAVPADAQPGEYLTSLVVQNAEATAADPVGAEGGVNFKQVVRQAIAVSIDLPGPRLPALQIGAISVRTVADRSSIAVAVDNTGNVKLKPSGEFVLWDAAGTEITRFPVVMDSVYAHTDTYAEVPFAERLLAGEYIADLSLTDASGVSATSNRMALRVPDAEADTVPQPIGGAPPLAQANQTPLTAQTPEAAVTSTPPINPWTLGLIAFGTGIGLMLAVGGVIFAVYRRRRA